jgi:hypothetical protein
MREAFPAYRATSASELKTLWSKATFSFDANVLLDLYKSEPETNEQFFSVLEKLKDRIWLSHQAALEFYDNRAGVISRARKELASITEMSKTAPHFLRTKASNKITEILSEESEHLRDFLDNDPIESRLNKLFSGKVGEPYKNLHDKYIEAEQRFRLKVPPGFRDVPEKQDYKKYGDVILWFQLLDHGHDSKHSLIFVTGDSKTDWWLVGEQKKKYGPRPELAQELKAYAGVEFHMYTPSQFIKHATEFAFLKVNAPSAKQAAQDLQRIEKEKDKLTIGVFGQPSPPFFINETYPRADGSVFAYPTLISSASRLVDAQGNPLLTVSGSAFSPLADQPMFFQSEDRPVFFKGSVQPVFFQSSPATGPVAAGEAVPEKKAEKKEEKKRKRRNSGNEGISCQ